MRLHDVFETHHAYDDPDWRTEFQPFRAGDTLRVFHGFRDLSDAVAAAKQGLSGRARANRVYSYEFDNNPQGLFVTLSLKVASEFAGSYQDQAVMEFVTPIEDLEAPVWPGGGYTVQGQMAQYFGGGAKGRAARRQRTRDAEAEAERLAHPEHDAHVLASDKRYLAYMLSRNRELQALYVGHLEPRAIVAFHVRPPRYDAPFERLSREEFLARYGNVEEKREHQHDRVFSPAERFDSDAFIERMTARYRSMRREDDEAWIRDAIGNMWQNVRRARRPAAAFVDQFGNYLWPKQYVDAMRWMKITYPTDG